MTEAELIRHTISAFAVGVILGVALTPHLADAVFAILRTGGEGE